MGPKQPIVVGRASGLSSITVKMVSDPGFRYDEFFYECGEAGNKVIGCDVRMRSYGVLGDFNLDNTIRGLSCFKNEGMQWFGQEVQHDLVRVHRIPQGNFLEQSSQLCYHRHNSRHIGCSLLLIICVRLAKSDCKVARLGVLVSIKLSILHLPRHGDLPNLRTAVAHEEHIYKVHSVHTALVHCIPSRRCILPDTLGVEAAAIVYTASVTSKEQRAMI
jgi:hypothetical protein